MSWINGHAANYIILGILIRLRLSLSSYAIAFFRLPQATSVYFSALINLVSSISTSLAKQMSGAGTKRKSNNSGSGPSNTKKSRSKATGKGAATGATAGEAPPDAGNSAAGASGGGDSGGAAGEKTAGKGDRGGRSRNPHGIARDDVDESAKPTQRAFQRHIRMACGLLTADAVLGPADAYIDHYDRRFNEVDNAEVLMREIIVEAKKPNKEAFKRAERLIRDAKVIAKGEGGESGRYGHIAMDIALIPAEHIAFVFGAITRAGLKAFHPDVFGPAQSTYNQLHRQLAVSTFQAVAAWYGYTAHNVSLAVTQHYHLLGEMYDNFMFGTVKTNSRKENNSPGSLSKAIDQASADKRRARLRDRRYQEAKMKGCRKPILRLLKVKAAHSDDERPEGGDPKKNKGLHICTKEGRNPIVTAFARELDANIMKRLQRNPNRNKKVPESRIVTVPPTEASPMSRILPVGVPIDFWDPRFYNEELDIQEKAMYIRTGVAFPLPQFCNNDNVADWIKMPAKEFMRKYGNDVLAQYNIPTAEQLAAMGMDDAAEGAEDADDEESTDLEDTDDDEPMATDE
ncbi:hypothetical protein B0H11DRAFT_1800815 [Mycena galericulata]|nr:hypothetical protein B0H11DRAFT_1800815 [Mycena galericulata]